jgi:hypothetical protein
VFSPKSPGREGKKDRGENLGGFQHKLKIIFKCPKFSKNIFPERKTICGGK